MTKQPSYRFVGFEDEWKEVKLGEILVERNEQISENEEYQLMSFVQGKGVVPKSDRYDRSFLVKDDKKNYKKTEFGDFIYSSNNLDTGSIGFNKSGKALISPVYSIFYSKTKKESQFIAILSQRKEFINEMIKYRQGVVYGQFRIHESDFLNISILAPESNAQEALINFFQDIDQLISLQQRKLEVLKEQKKTYLKLLFPAKGQTKPALRFAGFEDKWKEVKLGKVGETYTGLSGKTKEDFGHGEGKFITYVNVFNNPLTDLYGLDSVEIDDKQRRVQYGDVLFTTSSETPEDVGLSSVWMGTEDNVYLNSFCFGYRPQKGIFDLYYLAFVLRSFSVRKEFMLLAQGISRFNISKTKVMDMSIHVPSLPEQEAIGSFFQDLDKAIAKQEEKVNQLKESKQTLLRKMFI